MDRKRECPTRVICLAKDYTPLCIERDELAEEHFAKNNEEVTKIVLDDAFLAFCLDISLALDGDIDNYDAIVRSCNSLSKIRDFLEKFQMSMLSYPFGPTFPSREFVKTFLADVCKVYAVKFCCQIEFLFYDYALSDAIGCLSLSDAIQC